MDLLEAAELLLEKVKLYNTPNSPAQKTFRLREEVRAIAMQIPCLLEGPEQAMHTVARQYTVCSALKICADLELAAKMPIDQPQTLDELARATSCDSRILRPVLRILAQNGIFSQDQDGNWQHTAMSKVITQAPFRAWLNSILEEKYQSSAQLPAFLSRNAYEMPSTGKAAYNSVYQTPLDFYTYANEKDHAVSQNFAVSMRELARTQLPFIVECYPFHDLPPETRFIDIAGGEGNLCFYLAKRLPHATFQLQDHITVVAQAENSYDTSLGGRIDFKAQDMYLPQPPIDRETYKNGAVFLLKSILHDHDDMQCRLILNNIIASMKYGDRLLIMETVLPEVGGSLSSSMSDMIILSMFGCGHRTLNEWLELIHGSGEVHTEVYGDGSSEFDGMMIFEVTLPDTRP